MEYIAIQKALGGYSDHPNFSSVFIDTHQLVYKSIPITVFMVSVVLQLYLWCCLPSDKECSFPMLIHSLSNVIMVGTRYVFAACIH